MAATMYDSRRQGRIQSCWGFEIDNELRWRLIRKEFRGKLNANVCGTDIEVFTWGDGFCSGALAIAYGSAVWHDLKTLGIHNRKKMVVIQTRCLLSIAGAFKATLIEILYVETILPPLQENIARGTRPSAGQGSISIQSRRTTSFHEGTLQKSRNTK